MNKTIKNTQNHTLKVMICAHIGFPVGGISRNYEILISSKLKEKVLLKFVETSGSKIRFSDRGKKSILNIIDSNKNFLNYFQTLIDFRPDIVHIGTAQGLSLFKHSFMAWFAHLGGSKVIMQFHFSYSKLMSKGLSWVVSRRLLSSCDGFIVISSEWCNLKQIFPDKIVKLIPNAIETGPFLEINRNEINSSKERINFLYIGHLGLDKGTYDLIASAILLNNNNKRFTVNLFGESLEYGDFEKIKNTIAESQMNEVITLSSAVYGKMKIEAFSSADVLLLPSYHEGMPISIIEAMAAGLPIIASNVGGIPDLVVENINGLLFSPSDVQSLALCMNRLITEDELRLNMGKASRKRAVELFDINTKVENLVKFYDEIFQRAENLDG